MSSHSILRRHIRSPRLRGAVLLLGAALLVTACQTLFSVFGGQSGPYYPHVVHTNEGVDCTTCHETAEDEALAGMPASENGCMLCHKDLDKNKAFEKTVAAFVVDGKPTWLGAKHAYDGEVKFDHGAHADAELTCEDCHQAEFDGSGGSMRLHGGKSRCMDCHADTKKGNDCAVCHKTLRAEQKPVDHNANWKRLHGDFSSRTIAGSSDTTCSQCHTDDSCTQCHHEEKPRNHTNFWRRRGHGLTAAMNRSDCTTCHQTDTCRSCHQNTKPLSHRGSFGSPVNTHCVSCHLPATGRGCQVCHETLPAHTEGPTLPLNSAHMTATSPSGCITCHLGLKHPNPGGDCRLCHK